MELCELCKGGQGDVMHAFWQCKEVEVVWNA